MKKIFSLIICLVISLFVATTTTEASFDEHYNMGQEYLSQFQYSSAISEFKKALRINYMDDSARVGLINSYLARGTYFANKDRNWDAAANDYRAALFYLKYYPTAQDAQNSTAAIQNATENLNQCLATQKFSSTAQSRYQKAKSLRAEGLFPEAGYEFTQAMSDINFKKSSLEQIADIMKVLGNDPKAVEYYQKAIAIDQNDSNLRLKYARVLDKLGQNDLAVEEYNFALSKCGDDMEILYALEKIYRQKLAQSTDDAEVIANLGAILQKQNRFDEALQYYTRAGQLNPSNVTTRLNVGTLYQQRKNYEAAIAAYDSILILYPDNVEANFYKAQCLALSGQKDLAITGFNKVIALDPTNKDAKTQVLDILKTTMAPSEMLEYLKRESAADYKAVDTMYSYALELHKQNNFDDAIAYYNEVLRAKTNNPEVYVNLAIAYQQKKDLVQATRILQDAKIKFPANKQILDTLADFQNEVSSDEIAKAYEYYKNNDYQKALGAYLAIYPATFESMSGIATCYKALNNDNQAIEFYKKALALDPTNSDVAYYIGVIYAEKEDWAQAKNYLKKAMAISKTNQRAKDLYQTVVEQANVKLMDEAIALYDKAQYIPSLKIINQVLADDSKNAYAYYYRGLINDEGKKYTIALVDYKKALQFGPDLTIVNYLIALDYDTLKQYKNALVNYKKYVSTTTETNEYKTYAQTRIKELKQYE
jgi:tetratricopeptide (TPR) repeat protein